MVEMAALHLAVEVEAQVALALLVLVQQAATVVMTHQIHLVGRCISFS